MYNNIFSELIMISIQKCPECSSQGISHDNQKGEIVCHDCGLVLEDKMINVEVPFKDNEDTSQSRTRDGVGAPLTYTQPDMGFQTNIGNYADLKNLSARQKYKVKRLQVWQRRTSSSIDRNLQFAMAEIKKIASFLKLPSYATEESARLYREAAFKGFTRGRSIEVIVAASVYMACRSFEIPIALDDLVRAYDGTYTKKEIGKSFRTILRELNIKVMPQYPADYIPKICTKLNLNAEIQTHAMQLLEKAEKFKTLSGKGPKGIAAAVVYISAMLNNKKIIQKKVADASYVTEVTLRNRYHGLVKLLEINPKFNKYKQIDYKHQLDKPIRIKKFIQKQAIKKDKRPEEIWNQGKKKVFGFLHNFGFNKTKQRRNKSSKLEVS